MTLNSGIWVRGKVDGEREKEEEKKREEEREIEQEHGRASLLTVTIASINCPSHLPWPRTLYKETWTRVHPSVLES